MRIGVLVVLLLVCYRTVESLPGFIDCESSLEIGRPVMGSPITSADAIALSFEDRATGETIHSYTPGKKVLVSASFGEKDEDKTLFVLRTSV